MTVKLDLPQTCRDYWPITKDINKCCNVFFPKSWGPNTDLLNTQNGIVDIQSSHSISIHLVSFFKISNT